MQKCPNWDKCRLSIVDFNACICFQIEIRCTKDGEWTAEFVMCPNLQGSCSAPPDLNSVEYSCDHGMAVGECDLQIFILSLKLNETIYIRFGLSGWTLHFFYFIIILRPLHYCVSHFKNADKIKSKD